MLFLLVACGKEGEKKSQKEDKATSAQPAKAEPAKEKVERPAEEKKPTEPVAIGSLSEMELVEVRVSADAIGSMKAQKLAKDLQMVSLAGVQFIDEERGFAQGNYATLVETSDGGKSWKTVTTSRSQMRDTHGPIVFADDKVAFTLSGSTLMKSEDGAQTWLPSGGGPDMTRLLFSSPESGWGLARDRVVRTTDGGQSWKPVFMPSYSFFAEIAISEDGQGWLMGQTTNKLAVWRSEDGGEKWQSVIAMKEDTDHEALGMTVVSGQELWLCGRGYLIHTADGGKSWRRFEGLYEGDAQFHDVVVSGEKLWLAGFDVASSQAFILHSANGGADWAPIESKLKPNQTIMDLEIVGDVVWAAGSGLYQIKS